VVGGGKGKVASRTTIRLIGIWSQQGKRVRIGPIFHLGRGVDRGSLFLEKGLPLKKGRPSRKEFGGKSKRTRNARRGNGRWYFRELKVWNPRIGV